MRRDPKLIKLRAELDKVWANCLRKGYSPTVTRLLIKRCLDAVGLRTYGPYTSDGKENTI